MRKKDSDNVVLEKSMSFAVRIVKLHGYLCNEKREYVMSRQLLKSGTSIGANIREAVYAQSSNDFLSKMSIALKEASETAYWLELLNRTEYLTNDEYESVYGDCTELLKLLTAITRKVKSP